MNWKSLLCVSLTILAVAICVSTVDAAILPGTPCSDPGNPCGLPSAAGITPQAIFNLLNDPGDNNLGIFVFPGDVIVYENPNGTPSNPSSWSDVVRFQNLPGVNGSTATIFADNENGVILPAGFALSNNFATVLEIQTGTGTDADFTQYVAGSATYQVHSDAANPEIPDPELPEPSTLLLLTGGLVAGVFRYRHRRMAQ